MAIRSFLSLIAVAWASLSAADLQPFPMPWNDTTPGVTNLRSWLGGPAGARGWVSVTPEGHYAIEEERIRFLGVNIGAASAFPSYERAEGHAARLARFGFNNVRFHHLEAPWDKSNVLIDYAQGTSRELSAERLDRLHYFIARLAEQGIYSNINLLVSREFLPGDGLGEEISRMDWKDQHILGFFHDAALELHKEHAAKLLLAPNPHRDGTPLAQDPAVAIVEIMNENGLVQKWYEGVLDQMPEVYRAALRERWNSWLRSKYETTAAMLSGWGAINEPLGENKLDNGGFAQGAQRWNLERHGGAQASAIPTAEFDGAPALRIEVSTPGGANWHVQLNQSGRRIEQGAVYTLSFWAKAASAVPITAAVQRAHTDWATLAPAIQTTLDTTWRRYTITWQNTVAEDNARVNFNGFGDRRTTVWLADVRFQPGGQIGGIPEDASLEAGTVPAVARGGSGATVGQRKDWVSFCLELEKNYWDEMYHFIKSDLGYPGIVFATIVANSPPNAQAGMDAFDSHAYWQHPTFPAGLDWNPDQWTVNNVSMVNDAQGGTLTAIARQRVAGRPHNVTEYQHPSPNTYASEAPLLAAAYAALQDWDGLWFYAYETGKAEYFTGFFDHGGHPGKMANNLLAASMFLRGDVRPAENGYVFAFTPDRETEIATMTGRAWHIADGADLGVPARLALVSRVALSIGPEAEGEPEIPVSPQEPALRSDTGELVWDNTAPAKGVVTVNTPRTKAVVGFLDKRSFDLGGVEFLPGNTRQDWATFGITLMEGESFDGPGGKRAVIVTTGEHANTGMIWKSEAKTSVGRNWGGAPSLIEAVPATVKLPVAPGRVRAWILDGRGERVEQILVEESNGKAALALGSQAATLWYEVEILPEE
jgi:hypothetical protein